MKGKIIVLILLVGLLTTCYVFAQDVVTITTYYPAPYGAYYVLNTQYLQAGHDEADYDYIRLSKGQSAGDADIAGNFFAGLMWNDTSPTYGDGDDFSIYTEDNRDIYIYTGTGKIVLRGAYGQVEDSTGDPGILKVKEIWHCGLY